MVVVAVEDADQALDHLEGADQDHDDGGEEDPSDPTAHIGGFDASQFGILSGDCASEKPLDGREVGRCQSFRFS